MPAKNRSGFANIYMAELLYRDKPQLERTALNRAIQKIAPVSSKKSLGWEVAGEENTFIYFHADHLVTYQGKSSPPQTCVMPHKAPVTPERFQEGMTQAWHWPQATAVLQTCTYSLLVTDFLASTLYYKDRLQIFENALSALMTVAPCEALYWHASQKLLDPDTYLAAVEFGESLYGALNVRLFMIEQDRRQRDRRELLMDTCGLAALGIPDLQCHFYTSQPAPGEALPDLTHNDGTATTAVAADPDHNHDHDTGESAFPDSSQVLSPNHVRDCLLDMAYDLFDKGNAIENGDWHNVGNHDHWRCEHQHAMAQPDRYIIDLDPGSPHYAGQQHHNLPQD